MLLGIDASGQYPIYWGKKCSAKTKQTRYWWKMTKKY
jgi:hypothetical protein